MAASSRNGGFPEMDLLRFSTAGSVDDGKSTLIGRLLYDTKSIFQDQLEAVERTSERRGEGYVNLALLTDGLRAEREQNITIDVAYRYFATPKRKFIIADTPGHEQYTRNMVTGASSAELAIVLIDARKGVLTQSKRHGFLASLLGIPHILVAVNKMDLVGWSEGVYESIVEEYTEFSEKLTVQDLAFIPISALHGDNLVEESGNTPWYDGATLLHHLETVNLGVARNLVDFRFPVQYVIRPGQDYRGYAGRVASGSVSPGEEVAVLPSGMSTRIRTVDTFDGPVPEAVAGDSVVLTVEDELDISRGDMIVRRKNLPTSAHRFEAIVCWLNERPLDPAREYALFHTTREIKALVERVVYRIDVNTLHREEVPTLGLNDIGRLRIITASPLFFDPYQLNQQTGSFVLVDPASNATVGAGMIRSEVREPVEDPWRAADLPAEVTPRPLSPNVVWEGVNIPKEEREERSGHKAAVLWFTGLSGAGKTTIAREMERRLHEQGSQTMLLDGDQVRHGLCGDLGFSPEDRKENIRRVAEVAKLFFEQGSIVLCTFVSPYREDRERVRRMFPAGRFFEIYVECDLEELKRRDPKGLYARAERGEIIDLSGVSAPYEAPERPELAIVTTDTAISEGVEAVLAELTPLWPSGKKGS
ncbi:MAG: sulfate adenylyltransferase subunit CysN [Longimicrobiaceae bacterium]